STDCEFGVRLGLGLSSSTFRRSLSISRHIAASPSRRQVVAKIVQHGITRRELVIQVPELPAGVTQQQPASQAVIQSAQIEKQQEDRADDERTMQPKETSLVGSQKAQLARQPASDEEGRDGGQERGVGHHRVGSSNA